LHSREETNMSRPENKMVMGYFAFDEKHHPALLSLVQPAQGAAKILDPFAGEGAVLEQMARAWHATPYANELDSARAEVCRQRFGAKQALRGDAERLLASNNAFSLVWINPPYDHDSSESGSKRLEFKYLRHSWKWGMTGALMMWVVYQHHLTEEAASFLAKNSTQVDVWACPGKHLKAYDQIVVVAIKGKSANPEALYNDILRQKAQPHLLDVQDEPRYTLPKANKDKRFVFTANTVEPDQGIHLIQAHGTWRNNGFQALLTPPPPPHKIQPIVAPRPGHTALVLAAGVANGAILENTQYGTVALRGKTIHTEEISRVDIEADPNDPDHQIKKTTLRLKPTTTLTLLSADGNVVEMDGDDALLKFITDNRKALAEYLNEQFQPAYQFDLNGMGRWLSKIRLKDKYPLYTAQKHVIGAITKGFEKHKGILLAGQMGVGKTALGSSVAISLSANIVQALQSDIRPNQVTLIIAPPHLIDKWQRELLSISRNIHVAKLQRHEDVKAFMQHAEKLGVGIPKIGLIKRDMTKLGSGHEPAIVWRKQARALWRHDQPTPHGYEAHERILREKTPQCPHCGTTIMRERKGQTIVADAKWLKSGKRECPRCHTPLWQMIRDKGSRPKAGHKYPPKPPRYRLDEYIKRHYADRLYLLIWDEVHESQHSDTGNGASFARLASCADKVLGLTGTPFNGRSSSLFNLEYALNPRVRQRFNWGGAPRFNRKERGARFFQAIIRDDRQQRGRAEARWVEQMGVRERVLEERPQYNADTGAYTGTTTYERPYTEAPGISPLLVAEMLEHSVYFSLKDLGKALPQFEETAIPVAMDADIASEYDQTRALLKDYLVQRRWEGDSTFRGAYLQWSMGWQVR
jgi:ribosomal protein S27AE/16S rRNA G966 N2-methylase RsmD